MRCAIILLLLLGPVAAEGPREIPLLNVQILDRQGVTTSLAGFYPVSGENRFQGHLGDGEIEVPFDRIREIRIMAASHPGGRPRAHLTLRSGQIVRAGFDEREGEQLFSGYASFGRVTYFFRDIRHLKILGRTARKDLPIYGPPAVGVDARVKDRQGVETQLVRFRRIGAVENVIPGIRGAAAISIPLRIVKRLVFTTARGRNVSGYQDGTATLKSGATVRFKLPAYEEQTVYRGEAEFGDYRIRLGLLRELEVHRITPALRELDPLAAAKGKDRPEGRPPR